MNLTGHLNIHNGFLMKNLGLYNTHFKKDSKTGGVYICKPYLSEYINLKEFENSNVYGKSKIIITYEDDSKENNKIMLEKNNELKRGQRTEIIDDKLEISFVL